MSRPVVFLTHTDAARDTYYGARALAALRERAEVRLNAAPEPLGTAALVAAAAGARVIVADRATAGAAGVFAGCPDLVAFVRGAVDIRNIDVAAASAAGVMVTQATPGFTNAVAELVLGFMVDLGRGVSAATSAYHAGLGPAVAMGRQLAGSVVGVIGYGTIGRRLVALLNALHATVLVADPHATVAPELGAQVALRDLLGRSDFVVCVAVATEATENLMDAAAFAAMKRGSFFVNVSRGNLVDEAALLAALDSGHVAGAALDVGRAADQMPTLRLAAHPRVVATPHVGGLTPPAAEHQAMETTRQVAAILAGHVPDGAVNAAAAWRLRGNRAPA